MKSFNLGKMNVIWGIFFAFYLMPFSVCCGQEDGGDAYAKNQELAAKAESFRVAVHNGIKYMASIDTLELRNDASDERIDEVKVFDRNEDYRKDPQKYLEGRSPDDLEPGEQWEQILFLRIEGNKLVMFTNIGTRYEMDFDTKEVAKIPLPEPEEELMPADEQFE